MLNGSRQEIVAKSERFSILDFDSYTMDFLSSSDKRDFRFKNAGERSLRELLTMTEQELLTPKNYRRFRLEGFKRLSLPFYNLSFMLIAIEEWTEGVVAATGLLTGVFNRRGNNRRVIATVLTMAAVQIGGLFAENMTMRNLNFVPLLFVFSMGPIFICPYLLKNAGMFPFLKWKNKIAAMKKKPEWLRKNNKRKRKTK